MNDIIYPRLKGLFLTKRVIIYRREKIFVTSRKDNLFLFLFIRPNYHPHGRQYCRAIFFLSPSLALSSTWSHTHTLAQGNIFLTIFVSLRKKRASSLPTNHPDLWFMSQKQSGPSFLFFTTDETNTSISICNEQL